MGAMRLARRCLWPGLPGLLVALLAVCAASPFALGLVALLCIFHMPFLLGHPGNYVGALDALRRIRVPAALAQLPEDEAGQLCRAASLFREHSKSFQLLTAEGQRAFEASCRRALPGVDEAARRALQTRRNAGLLNAALLPAPHSPPGVPTQPWGECAAAWRRKAPEELEGGALELHRRWGLLPLRERVVEPAGVREALARAENVRFDARSLLPARMFNTSVGQLHDLHLDRDIEFHAQSDGQHGFEPPTCYWPLFLFTEKNSEGGPGSLLEWLLTRGMTRTFLQTACSKAWTLGDIAANMPLYQRAHFHGGMGRAEYRTAFDAYYRHVLQGAGLLGSNVNALRLPNWTRGEADPQDVAEKVGLGGLVEHAHNLLWFGVSTGGIHSDIQDNILVQLTGESDVFMVPANCSFGLNLGAGFDSVDANWIQEQGEGFPFFLVRLRAGEGLAVPSSSMHTVSSQDPRRVAMNFFFEPRHGQMRWPRAPANFYNYADKGHLAMRALWLKTVKDLWETRGPGAPTYVMHGQRQEFV